MSTWLVTQLNDFEPDKIGPVLRPTIEQRRIVRFHQLEATIAVRLEPALDVNQAVRKHPAFVAEAFVNFVFRTGREVFDHHVSLHRPFAAIVWSPSFLFRAIAFRVSFRMVSMSMVSPFRSSNVAISYFPPGLSRGSIFCRCWPRQNPNRTRSSSARMRRRGPLLK